MRYTLKDNTLLRFYRSLLIEELQRCLFRLDRPKVTERSDVELGAAKDQQPTSREWEGFRAFLFLRRSRLSGT